MEREVRSKTVLTFIMILFLLMFSWKDVKAFTENDYLHVRIKQDTEMGIKATSAYKIYIDDAAVQYNIPDTLEYFKVTKDAANPSNLKVIRVSDSFVIGAGVKIEFRQADPTQIDPALPHYAYVEGLDGVAFSRYPDNFTFKYTTDKTNIMCINDVRMENYLKGVLPYEMSAGYELEALKAQAAAARTYAIANQNKYASQGFGLTNDTYCQVYRGYDSTYFSPTNKIYLAVEGTEGKVITYNGALISALFYAANGGHTADPAIVWGGSYAYFKAKPDTFDSYSWTTTLTRDDVRNKLTAKGYSMGTVADVDTYAKTDYGYVTELRVTDIDSNMLSLKNDRTRTSLDLKSMFYSITKIKSAVLKGVDGLFTKTGTVYVKSASGATSVNLSTATIKTASGTASVPTTSYQFDGGGYGHGVGMSQIGANARAKAGQTYIQIIGFYYDGVLIKDNYNN